MFLVTPKVISVVKCICVNNPTSVPTECSKIWLFPSCVGNISDVHIMWLLCNLPSQSTKLLILSVFRPGSWFEIGHLWLALALENIIRPWILFQISNHNLISLFDYNVYCFLNFRDTKTFAPPQSIQSWKGWAFGCGSFQDPTDFLPCSRRQQRACTNWNIVSHSI